MNQEAVAQIQNGILCNYKKGWNIAIYYDMDGIAKYHVKWNKSKGGRQTSDHLIHLS